MLHRTAYRLARSAIVLLAACAAAPDSPQGRPNVVLIMTDDQGLGDLGWHGNPTLDTPNLDALAADSARLERFYVHPVCTPTRAALMSGRYPYRTRAIDTYLGRAMMEPEECTVAELLREAGYVTGIFGKWHLGDCHPMRPQDQGFDRVLVHRGGGIGQPSDPPEAAGQYTDPVLLRDGIPTQTVGYCTDVYFDAASRMVSDCSEQGRPFFVYLPTNAPHGPFHDVPDEPYARYRERLDVANNPELDRRARIFAMIENIDRNVGRLLEQLDRLGLADDTLVIYLHDNGPNTDRYRCGLRGRKSSVYEGGIRSPLFVRWPRRLVPAEHSGHWGAHLDLLPTILEACGVAAPPDLRLDGRSLLPLLEGRAADWPRRTLFVQSHRGDVPVPEHHFATITDRFKLVRHSGFGRERPRGAAGFELYDLVADPFERRDLAAEHPEVVTELRAQYEAWFADVSATRPDNFAPPRIRIGSAAEPVTVLTRQDWRTVQPGGGWGAADHVGRWLLDVAVAGTYEVRCLLRQTDDVNEAVLRVADRALRIPLAPGAKRLVFPPIELPAGPTELRVGLVSDAGTFGIWQAVIRKI